MDPRGIIVVFYKEENLKLLHTKIKGIGLVVSEKKAFVCFSHCKYMYIGANDPRGGAIFDPRGMIGRIYKGNYYTLLSTKYKSSGLCGFREENVLMFFPL